MRKKIKQFLPVKILIKIILIFIKLLCFLLSKVDSLLDVITDRIAYDKVMINFFLTFITPILLLNLPISETPEGFFSSWLNGIKSQLHQGLLFSTTMSIAATYISTYVSRVDDLASQDESFSPKNSKNDETESLKEIFNYLAHYSNTLFWALAMLLISALFLGISRNSPGQFNIVVIVFQLILYFGILITYGYSEKINKEGLSITQFHIQKKNEVDSMKTEDEKNSINFSKTFEDIFKNERNNS